ncbi:MAG: putative mannosyl-3-phosphoglycerate phosphatase (HAD superfamily), partial [Bacteroidia bacterium]
MNARRRKQLIFTDLDGSLLDHYTYSFRSALPVLRQLERRLVPVVPVSSKTRAELEPLRHELANVGPFIVENGAAIFVPEGYFEQQPAGTTLRKGFWVREFVGPRQRWLDLLDGLRPEFFDEFDCF